MRAKDDGGYDGREAGRHDGTPSRGLRGKVEARAAELIAEALDGAPCLSAEGLAEASIPSGFKSNGMDHRGPAGGHSGGGLPADGAFRRRTRR